jgi:hypothetical protein
MNGCLFYSINFIGRDGDLIGSPQLSRFLFYMVDVIFPNFNHMIPTHIFILVCGINKNNNKKNM